MTILELKEKLLERLNRKQKKQDYNVREGNICYSKDCSTDISKRAPRTKYCMSCSISRHNRKGNKTFKDGLRYAIGIINESIK